MSKIILPFSFSNLLCAKENPSIFISRCAILCSNYSVKLLYSSSISSLTASAKDPRACFSTPLWFSTASILALLNLTYATRSFGWVFCYVLPPCLVCKVLTASCSSNIFSLSDNVLILALIEEAVVAFIYLGCPGVPPPVALWSDFDVDLEFEFPWSYDVLLPEGSLESRLGDFVN